MARLPHKTLERSLFGRGYHTIIGVDEVGMGCLAGPVVVCAVAFRQKFFQKDHEDLRGLRDSKLLDARRRERFAIALKTKAKKGALVYRLAYCYPATIDRINIYQAARHAMRRAVARLGSARSTMVLVDGDKEIHGLDHSQRAIIQGDRTVFAIACASVLAKVYRDRMMARYAQRYPGYGFEIHKGYGTSLHRERLRALGPCAIHRRSFAPVANLLY